MVHNVRNSHDQNQRVSVLKGKYAAHILDEIALSLIRLRMKMFSLT